MVSKCLYGRPCHRCRSIKLQDFSLLKLGKGFRLHESLHVLTHLSVFSKYLRFRLHLSSSLNGRMEIQQQNSHHTIMYSSRMRTTRFSCRLGGGRVSGEWGVCLEVSARGGGGVCLGGVCLGGCLARGVSALGFLARWWCLPRGCLLRGVSA